jgi:hypothetical protein
MSREQPIHLPLGGAERSVQLAAELAGREPSSTHGSSSRRRRRLRIAPTPVLHPYPVHRLHATETHRESPSDPYERDEPPNRKKNKNKTGEETATHRSADPCTSSAAGKKGSFSQRSNDVAISLGTRGEIDSWEGEIESEMRRPVAVVVERRRKKAKRQRSNSGIVRLFFLSLSLSCFFFFFWVGFFFFFFFAPFCLFFLCFFFFFFF